MRTVVTVVSPVVSVLCFLFWFRSRRFRSLSSPRPGCLQARLYSPCSWRSSPSPSCGPRRERRSPERTCSVSRPAGRKWRWWWSLKEQFNPKFQLNHYLLTSLLMERQVKFVVHKTFLELCSKNYWKVEKVNTIYNSSSVIQVTLFEKLYLQLQQAVQLVHPLQTGCTPIPRRSSRRWSRHSCKLTFKKTYL